MTDLDHRFMDAVDEMSAEVRVKFPAIQDIEWPHSHTGAFASGASFALQLLSASEQLFEIGAGRRPIPISPKGAAVGDYPDPGFDRLCEIFVQVWERRRRDMLNAFLRRLGH